MIDRLKQHLLLPLIGVAVGTLVWQLYLLASTSSSPTEMPKDISPKPATLSQTPTTPIEQHTANLAQTRELSAKQLQYLQLVNELRITQVKRLIAQDNEAIALSQQHVQKTNTSITQIEPSQKTKTPAPLPSAVPVHATQEDAVKLVYTGEQNGIWNATINVQGRLYDVVKGTKLPSGDTVSNIDQDVVILSQGPWKKVLSFYDMTRYYQPSQDNQARAQNQDVQPQTTTVAIKSASKVATAKQPQISQPQEPRTLVSGSDIQRSNVTVTTPTTAINSQPKATTAAVKPSSKIATIVAAKPEPKVLPTVAVKQEPKVLPTIAAKPESKVPASIAAKPEPKVLPTVVAKQEPKVLPIIAVKPESKAPAAVAAKPEPKVPATLIAATSAEKTSVTPVMLKHSHQELAAKTTLLITKPSEDDSDVPSLLLKPKNEVHKPVAIAEKKTEVKPQVQTVASAPAKKINVEIPVKVIAMIGSEKQAKPVEVKKPVAMRRYNEIERQLLTQDPQQYTLQVFAADDLASVQRFLNHNGLAGKAKVYTRYQNNHPQHIAVIEHFKTAEDALHGLTQLPIELHQYAPEVKSIASIQQELKTVS